jgi:mutator protein MutT
VTVVVSAAVISRGDRYLVTRRQRGVHLEGLWEFPGGKCEPDESIAECLRRELREELGTDAVVGAELLAVAHDYEDRRIELHFIACELIGEPSPLLGQEMQWVTRAELRSLQFPPADDELIAMLERDER